MPNLNVSFVLDDPAFQDEIEVIRSKEDIGDNGRSQPQVTTFKARAVVTQKGERPFVLEPDSTRQPHAIIVHLRTKLYGVVVDYKPDVVLYQGNRYVVTSVDNWSRYGQGFYAASCEIIDLQTAS